MKIAQRKAVSPIIATLLLIAITVAAGIIVYVFVGTLAGSFTKSGGNQVTEQVSLDAYNYQTPPTLTMYFRNTGTGLVNVTSVFFDGTPVTPASNLFAAGTCHISTNGGHAVAASCTPGETFILNLSQPSTTGASNAVKLVTVDGGTFTYNVIAGQSG